MSISIEDLNKPCNRSPCNCLEREQLIEAVKTARDIGDNFGDAYEEVLRLRSEPVKKDVNSTLYKKMKKTVYTDLNERELTFLSTPKTNPFIVEEKVVRDADLDEEVYTRVICCPDKSDINVTIPGRRLEREYVGMFVRNSDNNFPPCTTQVFNIGTKNVTLRDKDGCPFVSAFDHEFLGKEYVLNPKDDVTFAKLVNGVAVKMDKK